MFGINASKLRFYESEFNTLQPKTNSTGKRQYTRADIDHLREILDLTQNQGYTLPGARDFLASRADRQRENARYVAKLQQIKAFPGANPRWAGLSPVSGFRVCQPVRLVNGYVTAAARLSNRVCLNKPASFRYFVYAHQSAPSSWLRTPSGGPNPFPFNLKSNR